MRCGRKENDQLKEVKAHDTGNQSGIHFVCFGKQLLSNDFIVHICLSVCVYFYIVFIYGCCKKDTYSLVLNTLPDRIVLSMLMSC